MKSRIQFLTLLIVMGSATAKAQFGEEQIITSNAFKASFVFATDIDGDGDIDVLSSSQADNKIDWYENTNGQGSFAKKNITADATEASAVYAVDIDDDGDMDVLSASFGDNKIAWYENTNGQGNFGQQQIITTGANKATSVYAADIDGDGDMDVLSASFGDSKIAWYENTDGQGSFGQQKTITISATEASAVYAADIDGDGDMDVLSASGATNGANDKIAWYENIDGQGNFGAQQIITTNLQSATSVYAADIDGDGDMDVLSASVWDGKIAWYKNNGQGGFGTQQVITTSSIGGSSVYAADLDDDGDMDVLSASASVNENKIAWYENLTFTSTKTVNVLSDFLVYPIPAIDVLIIESETDIVQIEIYNNLGQLVLLSTVTVGAKQIDVSSLNHGFYFCKIKDKSGKSGVKRIIKS